MKVNKLIMSLLLVIFFSSVNADEKVSYGDKSQNITAKGNVNTNNYDAGDKIAYVRIDKKNINKRKTIISTQKNFNIKKLQNLVIPEELGFVEIFYNKKTNNFYIKNHKYNIIKKTYISTKTNNYIDNSITKINKSKTTNYYSTKNGTIQGNVYNGDNVKEKRVININNSTFTNIENYTLEEGDRNLDISILKFNNKNFK